jgi:hypothetical protein
MGRPVYPHELNDPDFSWLINSFRESNPNSTMVDISCLPLVLFREGAPVLSTDETANAETKTPFDGTEDDEGGVGQRK